MKGAQKEVAGAFLCNVQSASDTFTKEVCSAFRTVYNGTSIYLKV